jgi:hypothetical protein
MSKLRELRRMKRDWLLTALTVVFTLMIFVAARSRQRAYSCFRRL